jgi:chloramphenicol O-acetyltransferase type A
MTISENGKEPCPSIHVHHGLMDGSHLGQFVDYFQEIMNQ